MKEYQVNFQTYQNFLGQTKDIFNWNYAIKIESVKNFEKNFSNENAKAFKFTKFRSIAFLLVLLVAGIIILTPVIIGIIFFALPPSTPNFNVISTIAWPLCLVPILLTPFITWALAQIFWKLIFSDFDVYKKIVIQLVDHQTIDFAKFCQFPCAIGLLMTTSRRGLSYKINHTNMSNEMLLNQYYQELLHDINDNIKINHNQIVHQISANIQDCDYSLIAGTSGNATWRVKIRPGFSLSEYFYFCAAIYKNYWDLQNPPSDMDQLIF